MLVKEIYPAGPPKCVAYFQFKASAYQPEYLSEITDAETTSFCFNSRHVERTLSRTVSTRFDTCLWIVFLTRVEEAFGTFHPTGILSLKLVTMMATPGLSTIRMSMNLRHMRQPDFETPSWIFKYLFFSLLMHQYLFRRYNARAHSQCTEDTIICFSVKLTELSVDDFICGKTKRK